ncbi:uncharacterized protein LOC134694277 [Mytilus trossulus]|uniref:uncharacterized protein LOC134694277 n=1 Tax=Mytilus trossulus TaxID=6551 RepID=UPI003006F3A7
MYAIVSFSCLIEFVKGQYPDEVEGVVREGIKTNFESFKAKKRREETGKQEEHNKKMAVYSRLKRKLNNRKKALKEISSMPKEQKETVMQSMETQYMSSEQTDSELRRRVVYRHTSALEV